MALGDITLLKSGEFGAVGSRRFKVAASATIIYPGEPVLKALGNTAGSVVSQMATNEPTVATDYLAGIAASTSTNTATAAGVVDVIPLMPGQVWLMSPNDSTAWDTQAEYDALVGTRVLMDLTDTSFTILSTNGDTYGCVIEPLDISKYPKKVAFSFRRGCSYLA